MPNLSPVDVRKKYELYDNKICTGDEAADLLEHTLFDLILLDVMLPGVDGFALMDYIAPTGTPVIFLTAKATVEVRVRGLRLGACDYIVKDYDCLTSEPLFIKLYDAHLYDFLFSLTVFMNSKSFSAHPYMVISVYCSCEFTYPFAEVHIPDFILSYR